MREILFRGKRKDNGVWVEGFYYEDILGNPVILSRPRDFGYADVIDVDPFTVGQYTGLKDKNGNRIFEGDILSLRTGRPHVVRFENGAFVLENTAIPVRFANKFEVIGNIHDNPELPWEKGGASE